MLNSSRTDGESPGVAILNSLFLAATSRHGSDLAAVLDDVREGVSALPPEDRKKALDALSLAVPVTAPGQ
ncbi:hypothetical protein [Consotaella salsifontis]|uniref:Uncharacterized protein n=1 Tax=Consotaella salsifontis TaxID=1365950 RepID=A0A1T4P8S5_9HYPH|nr:hypothetical protein [Consotaella salsifontis]SJZ87656.1 hypothetical protein SAMN05428963_103386 [Consotaella salsifontis]